MTANLSLSIQWRVDSLADWIEAHLLWECSSCPQTMRGFSLTRLYKTPDSVSIRPVNHTGPMVEGKEYQLLCEFRNIAPVQVENGVQYRCVAELELGPEDATTPPTVTSRPLNASVPQHSSVQTEVLDLTEGAEIFLNCTATKLPTVATAGNPPSCRRMGG
ncbi:hemicentin-2-like isoform X3 [Lates japonicus]|uniref:Hemicentin-2-like isoform X3 n=1 Tax=Lates japonicus TaxID=270547 RepID=A0AAD3M8Q4_LATJO|nr:hemicentin-2-like isoform X3 [Lates japonicus]